MEITGCGSKKPFHGSYSKQALIIIAVFGISRYLAYVWGVRFDFLYIYKAVQVLDVYLLQNRLVESIWNLHSQPPLFNLFLGVVIKWFPQNPEIAFRVIYLGIGLTLGLSMLALARAVGIPGYLAVTLTVAFLVNPTTISYENLLFYDYPTTCMLCIAALMWVKWAQTDKLIFGSAFFVCAATVIMTRSLFQLVWLALACVPLLICSRMSWKQILVAAIVPVLLVLGWQIKNFHRFGVLTTSSLLGMNLSRNTVKRLGPEEKGELVKQGVISTIAAIPTYSEFDSYRHFIPSPMKTGVPALDMKIKSPPSLQPNFNYSGYIVVSKCRMKDALHFILARPTQFARNVLDAFAVYFKPAGQYFYIAHRWKILSVFQALYKIHDEKSILPCIIQVFIASCYVLAIVYGACTFYQGIRRGSIDVPASSTISFMWVTVVYAAVVTNLTDIWENNRIRFMTDPFVWIMVGLCISQRVKCCRFIAATSDHHSSSKRLQTEVSKPIIQTVLLRRP